MNVIPLHPVEPELSAEHEDECWAILDAITAAEARGDMAASEAAHLALLDFQLRHGLLSRDELRRMLAPNLLQLIRRADETPEGRELLQQIRDDALESLNGDDYAESTAAALFIMSVDAVQAPRLHEARRARALRERTEWVDRLRSVETRTELACLQLWRHAWGDAVDERNVPRTEDIREAWTAVRAAKRRVQEMLGRMGQPVRPEGLHHSRRKPGGEE